MRTLIYYCLFVLLFGELRSIPLEVGVSIKITPAKTFRAGAMDSYRIIKFKADALAKPWKQSKYSLNLFNQQLPEQLEPCYVELEQERLAKSSSNPAEYGEKMCGLLKSGLICSSNVTDVNNDSEIKMFNEEVKHLMNVICDSDCPFAQMESCKSQIAGTFYKDECWFQPFVSCVDILLPTLDCLPKAKANIYWIQERLLGLVGLCHHVNKQCMDSIYKCMTPLSEYLYSSQYERLCGKADHVSQCLDKCSKSCLLSTDLWKAITYEAKAAMKSICNTCSGGLFKYSVLPASDCRQYLIKMGSFIKTKSCPAENKCHLYSTCHNCRMK